MTHLHIAAEVAVGAAAITAIGLARQRSNHRPAAIALTLLAVAAMCRLLIVPVLNDLPLPVEGAARLLVYCDGVLVLASSAVIAGLAVTVSSPTEERSRAASKVVAAWALASVALAVAYPSPLVRGEGLHRIYLIADLAGCFVSIVAIWKLVQLRLSPTPAQSIAIGLVVLDLGIGWLMLR